MSNFTVWAGSVFILVIFLIIAGCIGTSESVAASKPTSIPTETVKGQNIEGVSSYLTPPSIDYDEEFIHESTGFLANSNISDVWSYMDKRDFESAEQYMNRQYSLITTESNKLQNMTVSSRLEPFKKEILLVYKYNIDADRALMEAIKAKKDNNQELAASYARVGISNYELATRHINSSKNILNSLDY